MHRMKGLLSPPTLSPAFNVEASIHKPPRMLRRDIELVFRPDLAAAHTREAAEGQSLDEYLAERLIAVPTWQPSKHDLSEMSFVVNEVVPACPAAYRVPSTVLQIAFLLGLCCVEASSESRMDAQH